jgi:hypothetical protein
MSRKGAEDQDPMICSQCQTPMETASIKKYPGNWPTVLICLGIFFTFFFIGAVLGIPMILLGIYMSLAKESVCHCPNCGNYFRILLRR